MHKERKLSKTLPKLLVAGLILVTISLITFHFQCWYIIQTRKSSTAPRCDNLSVKVADNRGDKMIPSLETTISTDSSDGTLESQSVQVQPHVQSNNPCPSHMGSLNQVTRAVASDPDLDLTFHALRQSEIELEAVQKPPRKEFKEDDELIEQPLSK